MRERRRILRICCLGWWRGEGGAAGMVVIKKITDFYSIEFEYGEEGIKVKVIPADGISQEEAEIAFAREMRGLADAGLVEIGRNEDGQIRLDMGGLLDDRSE